MGFFMARSYKKNLNYYTNSGKDGKRLANRKMRRINKINLAKYDEDIVFDLLREVSCVWDWRDYRINYFNSLEALKNEPWCTRENYNVKWWRYYRK